MIIELVGAPGAGKTTLLPAVCEFFQERHLTAFTIVQAARPLTRRTVLGKVISGLTPPTWRRAVLWQLFYRLGSLYQLKFMARHPRLAWQVFHSQNRRPTAADVRQRQVRHWYFRLAGEYEFLKRQLRPNELLVLDEGFVHRVVQLFASSAERPNSAQIAAYIDLLPQPDLVIFIQAPAEICQRRIYARGLWPRAHQKSPAEIAQFVANAHCAVNLAVAQAQRKGWPLVNLPNGGSDLAAAQAELHHQLAQVVSVANPSWGAQTA